MMKNPFRCAILGAQLASPSLSISKEDASMKFPSFVAALVVLAASFAPFGRGQDASPMVSLKAPLPACDGTYAIVRLIEVTNGSNVDQYMQALATHKAWYMKHGYKDQIFAAQILERDPKTDEARFSRHLVITYHFIEPGSKPPVHDAEWDAYVKEYIRTSTIKESYVACIPTEHTPRSMEHMPMSMH